MQNENDGYIPLKLEGHPLKYSYIFYYCVLIL
jgi:hypothetical protein